MKNNQLRGTLLRGINYFLIAYFLTTIFAYLFADLYMFKAPRPSYQFGKDILKIKTQDGATISALYLPNKNAAYTVLISHGNSEDLGYMIPFLKKFHDEGFAIFAYDYHGYGASTGRPTEKNAYIDINAAYDYLTGNLHVLPGHVIAYGRSLGAALAIDLAMRKPIAGLIIESPFLTAYRTITQVPLLLFDKFDNLSKIEKVKCPVLVIHGKYDFVVPFWQGKMIYKKANSPKYFFSVENAGHNNVAIHGGNAYWKIMSQFAQSLK